MEFEVCMLSQITKSLFVFSVIVRFIILILKSLIGMRYDVFALEE